MKLIKGKANKEAEVVSLEKKAPIDCTPHRSGPYTRYHTFKKMKVYSLEQPCVRISSKYEGSSEEIQRRVDLLNKAKWVSKKDFSTTSLKSALKTQSKNFIQNYVNRTPSQPALIHKFRDVDKNKFIEKREFKLC